VSFLPIDEQRFTIGFGLSNNISNRSVFNLSLKSHHYYRRSDLRSASSNTVTIWKVVFANNSRKLGWIWMKLGMRGWGLKRLSHARFQRNRTMGFGQSAKKMGRRGVFCEEAFFVTCKTHYLLITYLSLLPLSLYRFPPNFPRKRVRVVARGTWFHALSKH